MIGRIFDFCHFYRKSLNSIIGRNKYYELNVITFRNNTRDNVRSEKGQMFIMAAIFIAVSVIVLSVISVNLSNKDVYLPMEKSTSLVDEYRNVRSSFGDMLVSNIGNTSNSDLLYSVFERIVDVFSSLEISYGNYFDADIVSVEENSLTVDLILSNGGTSISEEIVYQIKG